MTTKVVTLLIKPGIQRDGTQFAAPTYVDGQWVRFQNGLPRKIGGYKGIFLNAAGISRGMTMSSTGGLNYVISGYNNGLQQWYTDNDDGVGFGPTNFVFIQTQITAGGTLYTDGTYNNVSLTGGSGSGATATIAVSGGAVTNVSMVSAGTGYVVGDTLSATAASLGGTGSGFQLKVISNNYFQPNDYNLWQFDIGYDSTGSGTNNLVAHPGQNLKNIDSTVNTRPLVGPFPNTTLAPVGVFTATVTLNGTTTAVLSAANSGVGAGVSISGTNIPAGTTVVSVTGTSITMSAAATGSGTILATFDNNISVSGGVVVLHPYLFVYGNNGLIQNSAAGDFNNWTSADSNANNVSTGKVIKGLPLRGGTTSPAGLFWTLDSVVRVTYSPSTVNGLNFYWKYDLITSQSSIMSSQCVIEYDGIFYWVGTDRFLMYNGVVQEIPNSQNQNWFFDNLNYAQRQKVWVTKIPRWGEIWFFYPRGDATECTDAIIYNTRDKSWYDAGSAPGAARSAGTFSEVFRSPIFGGNVTSPTGTYTLWQHESGTNEVFTTSVNAIQSYFETNTIGQQVGLVGTTPAGDNVFTRLERVEPDFVQVGDMNLYVTGKGYADENDYTTGPYTFSPTTLKIDMREQRREMRLRFESNTQNGDYFLGKTLLSVDVGDVRGTGNP